MWINTEHSDNKVIKSLTGTVGRSVLIKVPKNVNLWVNLSYDGATLISSRKLGSTLCSALLRDAKFLSRFCLIVKLAAPVSHPLQHGSCGWVEKQFYGKIFPRSQKLVDVYR